MKSFDVCARARARVRLCNIFLSFVIFALNFSIWLFYTDIPLPTSFIHSCISTHNMLILSLLFIWTSSIAPVAFFSFVPYANHIRIMSTNRIRINGKMINGFWYFLSFSALIYINDIAKPLRFHQWYCWMFEYLSQCLHCPTNRAYLYCDMHFMAWFFLYSSKQQPPHRWASQ